MSNIFIFLFMLFCHIVDDYYLQGWLASAKQKKYWEENAPAKMYKYDYIWALFMHSFSWAFMMMLPVFVTKHFDITIPCLIAFIINVFIHAIVDDLKANKRKINLIQDQSVHILQIVITFIVLINMGL